MDLREFYKSIGGNYDEAVLRIGSEERIVKYLNMFLSDANFRMLKQGLEDKDYETAFLATHTLKGLALNLSFGDFAAITSKVTELLRPRKFHPELEDSFKQLEESYNQLVKNINAVKGSAKDEEWIQNINSR